ncbi:MAG: hypothetical protein IKN53_04210 [Oscillibacter sp.]|nr:hypothetical protein [Oscillibacter sp.]
MRRVKCHDCGRIYNYDTDDFCPYCGAYTQPPRETRVDADGTVVRVDGLNESNHAGSFLHAERHQEDRERRRMGLSKSPRARAAAQNPAARGQEQAKPLPVGVIIILIIVIGNLLRKILAI